MVRQDNCNDKNASKMLYVGGGAMISDNSSIW